MKQQEKLNNGAIEVKEPKVPQMPQAQAPKEQPKAPVQEQPKAPVQEQPKAPVQEQPKPQVQQSMYQQAVAMVESLVPWDKFRKGAAGSGLSIFDQGGGRGTRLLKVVESKKGLRVEFNVAAVEPKLKELASNESTIFSEKEAKEKHMGTCRWIYTGSNLEVLKQLISEAIAGFTPKVKEEPKKEENATPAAEAQKKEEKPVEPVVAGRKFTEKELKDMEAAKGKGKDQQEQRKAQ